MSVAISERQFQDQIIQLATTLGWRAHAERPARTKDGWRTPIQGEPGWPDLVLVRGEGTEGRILFIELKREGGRLTKAQEDWARALRNAGGECYWFMPSEFELLRKVLDPEGRTE